MMSLFFILFLLSQLRNNPRTASSTYILIYRFVLISTVARIVAKFPEILSEAF